MSESSGGRAGASGVSDGADDRADSFVLSSIMSRVVGSVPHARPGAREFSLGGVLWKTALYGMAYMAGVACGWLVLTDDSQDWVRMRIVQSCLLALFSIFAVCTLLGRYEDGKGRPGPWFVVLSLPCAPGLGVGFGAAGRTSGGVFRWVLVSVAVLVAVGGVGVSAADAAGAQWVPVVGGDGGVVCGAVLDAGQGDGVGWRFLVLVLCGGRGWRLVVRVGHVGDREVRGHAS